MALGAVVDRVDRVHARVAELFVDGQRVTPDRALALGFRFRYATVGAALAAILMAQRGEPRAAASMHLDERPEAAAK